MMCFETNIFKCLLSLLFTTECELNLLNGKVSKCFLASRRYLWPESSSRTEVLDTYGTMPILET